jgi:hypothetical protein
MFRLARRGALPSCGPEAVEKCPVKIFESPPLVGTRMRLAEQSLRQSQEPSAFGQHISRAARMLTGLI